MALLTLAHYSQLNIANPSTGAVKVLEVDEEKQLRNFYDKRISQEVDGEVLGDEFKGYLFRISGGNDKQGFPMQQGVLVNNRVRLLMGKGSPYYRPRRVGERRRKSIRGCIVGPDLAVLNLVVLKKGEGEIPGLTDTEVARRLGPKRAQKIRKLFNLSKEDDVRKFVIARNVTTKKGGATFVKRPKIQRLVTPLTLQRKRHLATVKLANAERSREQKQEYERLVAASAKAKRASSKRSSRRSSRKDE